MSFSHVITILTLTSTIYAFQIINKEPIFNVNHFIGTKEDLKSITSNMPQNQLQQYFGSYMTTVATQDQINSIVKDIVEVVLMTNSGMKNLKYKFEIGYGVSGLKILETKINLIDDKIDIFTSYLDISVDIPQQYDSVRTCTGRYVKISGIKLWKSGDRCSNNNVPRGLNGNEIAEIKTHIEKRVVDHMYLFDSHTKEANVQIEVI